MASVKVNGEALETIRTRSGLSLRQLADASGVSFRHIRSIELGEHNPSWAIVQKIASALKIQSTALLVDPAASVDEEATA